MRNDPDSGRRSFLMGGAMLAAPVAAATIPAMAFAAEGKHGREDEREIAELRERWLRGLNNGARDAAAAMLGGEVRAIIPDHRAEPGPIRLSADGTRATQRIDCTVDCETALARDCTFAIMAHEQGNACARHNEARVLELAFARGREGWAVTGAALG